MAGIPDRAYNAACSRLATRLGISQSSARRKVDIRAAVEGLKEADAKRDLAERMLAEADRAGLDNGLLLTSQLEAVGNDENFMIED
jgi:hypothetical protein